MADAGRQGGRAGRDHVGLRRGPGPCLCRQLRRAISSRRHGRLDPNAGGGLFALDLASGKISMQVPPVSCGSRSQCSPALSAAVTAIPGVVFSGGVSGYLRAYATERRTAAWESTPRVTIPRSMAFRPMAARWTGPAQSSSTACCTSIPATRNGAVCPATFCWPSRSEISGHSHARRHYVRCRASHAPGADRRNRGRRR